MTDEERDKLRLILRNFDDGATNTTEVKMQIIGVLTTMDGNEVFEIISTAIKEGH